jgi:acetyl/propionyl-CoA carboxylase alpha subunit
MRIPLFYDSLLAKLICWGQDRDEAVARLRRALDEYVIAGVRTTIPFAQWITRQPRFLAGDFSTDYIAEEWRPEAFALDAAAEGVELTDAQVVALVASLVARDQGAASGRRRHEQAGEAYEDGWRWRLSGRKTATSGW